MTFSVFVGPLVDGLQVDHINCVSRACCNPEHLRQVSQSGNMQNQRGLRANNTSGHIGVCWNKRREKWYAQIQVIGKIRHLGSFTNLDDAIAARKAAEQKYHPTETLNTASLLPTDHRPNLQVVLGGWGFVINLGLALSVVRACLANAQPVRPAPDSCNRP